MPNTKATWSKPAVVYLITNKVNGHRYIGVTIRDIHRRWSSHKHEAKSASRRPIILAIQKYGYDAFCVQLISNHLTYEEALSEERRMIALWKPEYNATAGGEGTLGYIPSPESVAAGVAKRTGIKRSKPYPREAIERAKATRVANGTIPRYWLGKKRDPETFIKISVTQRKIGHYEKLRKLHSKPVRCCNDGLTYDSLGEAAAFYGVGKSSVFSSCAGKTKNPHSGLSFEYAGQ